MPFPIQVKTVASMPPRQPDAMRGREGKVRAGHLDADSIAAFHHY